MWWECSECGSQVERPRLPSVCSDCGTAGSSVASSDPSFVDAPHADDARAAWLDIGFESADAPALGNGY
jgi:predicted amidophosphoribosyltransferase